MVNSDPALDFMDRPVRAAGRLGSAIAVPIVSGSTLIGVMALYAVERDAFTSEMRDVVELIAREIAPMMERAADEPRGQMEAPRDPVTGFFDERYLTQVIESSPFTRGPLTQSLGVLSVTLPANSIAGHADVSVLGAAAAVRQAVRIADMAFRRGPRDIVVLMPNCDPGAGQAVVERLLMALAADESGAAAGGLEVGFACAPGQGTSAAVLVEAAHARAARVKPGWTGESDASESVFGVGTAAGRW
jgi:GGDEF domain-containing protein